LLIYVRESNAKLATPTYSGALTLPYSQNCLRSKAFCGIKNVNITFNSLTGILNNASQHQLYEYSLETGLEMSFPQFQKYRGSVIALRFGSHIPLINPDLAPGCRGSYNFQVSVQAYNTNTSHEITAPNLYVLPYYEGTIIARPGVWIQQQGVISNQNVLESMNTPPVNAYYSDEITGSGPFSFLKSIISKIAPIAEKVYPIVKALAPALGPLIGLGLNEGDRSMTNIISQNEEVKQEIRNQYKKLGGSSNLVGRLAVRK